MDSKKKPNNGYVIVPVLILINQVFVAKLNGAAFALLAKKSCPKALPLLF